VLHAKINDEATNEPPQPHEYAPRSSVVFVTDPPSSHVSRLMPERADVEYTREFGSVIPPGAMPKFNVSTVTYPPLAGGFDESTGIHHSSPTSSTAQYTLNQVPQLGPSPIIPTNYPTSGVKAEPENDASIPDLPLERRQKQSKNRRQQPYDKQQQSTRPREATAIIFPSDFDPAPAIASFLTRQAIICPILIKGKLCGESVNTAHDMADHLFETHGVDSNQSPTANVGLGGLCPHCGSRLTNCIYRHLMSDFHCYACLVEGCGNVYSRPAQL
jgi:hypothetical protein